MRLSKINLFTQPLREGNWLILEKSRAVASKRRTEALTSVEISCFLLCFCLFLCI